MPKLRDLTSDFEPFDARFLLAVGEKVFGVCKACHQIGETAKNSVGPVLNGLIGRKAGSVPDYSYSSANKESGSPRMRPPSANTSRTRKRKSPAPR